MSDSIKPTVKVQKTTVLLNDQGYTYNEAGQSYNEAGVAYGGLYGYDTVSIVQSIKIDKPYVSFSFNVGGSVLPGERIIEAGMLMGVLGITYPESGTVVI